MALDLLALCIDARDAAAMARFWAAAVDGEAGEHDGEVSVRNDAIGFRIDLLAVPSEKAGQNRQHLHVTTTSAEDHAATIERLLDAGGSHLDVGQLPEETHVVLADPEGNELCVIEPGNRFLAGCPRLGEIACDGTHALGLFWQRALGWPLVWDEGRGDGDPTTRWARSEDQLGRTADPSEAGQDRLHLHVAPIDGADVQQEVERLVALGATRLDLACAGRSDRVVLADVDGNELCVCTG